MEPKRKEVKEEPKIQFIPVIVHQPLIESQVKFRDVMLTIFAASVIVCAIILRKWEYL
jgi:hypothetical protein